MTFNLFRYENIRPTLITLICVLGFIYVALGLILLIFVPGVTYELIRIHGKSFPIITAVINIFILIAFAGIWQMKYWGILLYGIMYVAGSIYGYYMGIEFWWGYIPGLIVILSCLFYLNRFR